MKSLLKYPSVCICGICERFFIAGFFLFLILFSTFHIAAQDFHAPSIHQEESEEYSVFSEFTEQQFDSLMKITVVPKTRSTSDFEMQKVVFGYHPYWVGSAYYYYQWGKLTDLCFFSYELDPSNGEPADLHGFLNAPVIDSALANGTRVHLCVTLFSNHALFLENEVSQQNLVDNLITLMNERGAIGVNIDFEAVSSSQSNNLNDFIVELASQIHDSIEGSKISIAAPAVDWNSLYNIPLLNQYIDYFMIMGYDYYWNGSTYAGPVDGLYSMQAGYNYNLSRTLSYYQKNGADNEKILLGLPYYARQWPTEYRYAPSEVTGWGQALTYYQVKNSASGYYTAENKIFEQTSFSPYYSFESNGWNQCFIDDVYSMGKRFDLVNYRGVAGIGIWALGYDNGYDDFWNLIGKKFSNYALHANTDTIYDSGGPFGSYFNNEDYTITIFSGDTTNLVLEFQEFDLESVYDSLFIYDGKDTLDLMIGGYSGTDLPPVIESGTPWLTLHFVSDEFTVGKGWEAIWRQKGLGSSKKYNRNTIDNTIEIFPNPGKDIIQIEAHEFEIEGVFVFQNDGKLLKHISLPDQLSISSNDLGNIQPGVYVFKFYNENWEFNTTKWVYQL